MSTLITRRHSDEPSFFSSPMGTLRHELDRFFDQFTTGWDRSSLADFNPACDVSETPDAFQVSIDLPGMKPEDVHVEVAGNSLRISGKRQEEKRDNGKTFHRVERRTGSFSEAMTLPCDVREDGVEAEFHDGILTVTLPKAETAKPRAIEVHRKEDAAK